LRYPEGQARAVLPGPTMKVKQESSGVESDAVVLSVNGEINTSSGMIYAVANLLPFPGWEHELITGVAARVFRTPGERSRDTSPREASP
jgi:hypothetical protein